MPASLSNHASSPLLLTALCLRGGQVCSNVDLCKKKTRTERKRMGRCTQGTDEMEVPFFLKKQTNKQNLPYLVHLCTNWQWYFLSPFLLCVCLCVCVYQLAKDEDVYLEGSETLRVCCLSIPA